jgi:hypothetical protein
LWFDKQKNEIIASFAMTEFEKYQVCFGGHHKPKPFATQDALADWIYEKLSQERKPNEIRLLDRIESVKFNGRVVASKTLLGIWRAVERRRDQAKNTQTPTP